MYRHTHTHVEFRVSHDVFEGAFSHVSAVLGSARCLEGLRVFTSESIPLFIQFGRKDALLSVLLAGFALSQHEAPLG